MKYIPTTTRKIGQLIAAICCCALVAVVAAPGLGYKCKPVRDEALSECPNKGTSALCTAENCVWITFASTVDICVVTPNISCDYTGTYQPPVNFETFHRQCTWHWFSPFKQNCRCVKPNPQPPPNYQGQWSERC